MGRLTLVHASDAESLLREAAAPFAVRGRPAESLPLLAVRQGGQRDDVIARAAAAGSSGWLGEPVLVFRELLDRLADGDDVAPLTSFEREALLARLLRGARLSAFGHSRHMRGLLLSLDDLFGRLIAADIAPDALARTLARERETRPDGRKTVPAGAWDRGRDSDVAALYADWREAISALPPLPRGPRVDGRDAAARAARAVRADPTLPGRRLGRPFARPDTPVDLWLLGLTDLTGGWDLLIDALHASPAVRELRVLILAPAAGRAIERLAEVELLDALLTRADDVVPLEHGARAPALTRLTRGLFLAADEGSGPADAAPGRPPGAGVGPGATVGGEPASGAVASIFPDTAREMAAVAREAKRLIADEGVDPRAIAVVVRGLRPEGPGLVHELRRQGVPVTARLRYRAAEIPAVAALLRLFRLAADGWSRAALLDLAESPYVDIRLDAGALGFAAAQARPRTLAQWRDALEGFARAAEAVEADQDGPPRRGPSAARLRAAAERIADFATHAGRLEEPRLRSAWIALAAEALEDSGDAPWRLERAARRLPGGRDDDPLAVEAVRLDLQGIETARDALRDWRRALSIDPDADEALEPGAWYRELGARLQDADFALWTPRRGGVRVLESLAAVGRPFDHVFIVGMAAGEIPADPPAQPLFADTESEALVEAGLPFRTESEWFAREASLFRALVAGARRTLYLSYAAADGAGAPRLASPYLEECALLLGTSVEAWANRVPGSALVPAELQAIRSTGEALMFAARAWRASPEGDAGRAVRSALRTLLDATPVATRRALRAAWVEWLRARTREAEVSDRSDRLHAFNGRVDAEDLREALLQRWGDRIWSASRLETYGFCGFRFFAEQMLGLGSVDEAEDDLDAATRGRVLHASLARLYDELTERFGDAALEPVHAHDAEQILDRLLPEVLASEADGGWMGAPELRAPRVANLRRTLLRYVRWEMEENAKDSRDRPSRRPLYAEFAFGAPGDRWGPAELTDGDRRLRLRGRIDRVDEIVNPRAAGWRYVVDHKSSAASFNKLASRRAAGAMLQLPLYMSALEALGEAGAGIWGGSYQIIGDPANKAPLKPTSLVKRGVQRGANKTQEEDLERLEDAVRQAIDHTGNIIEGRFPAASPDGCRCPPYCPARAVCREYSP